MDVCFSHYNYLAFETSDILLRTSEEDRLNLGFFQSSTLQAPHYLACFSQAYSTSETRIPEEEYKELRNLMVLWLFLTEIPYSGVLDYFEFLRLGTETHKIRSRFKAHEYLVDTSRFGSFLKDYSTYEACRPVSILPRIFTLALEDLAGLNDLILNQTGYNPSLIIKALYSLTLEWSDTYKLSRTDIENRGFDYVAREYCNNLLDFPSDYCQRVLKRYGIAEAEHTLSAVTMTSEIAGKYIASRKTRKRNEGLFMYTFPLWDYPLLQVNGAYLSHVILFAESFPELSNRFINSSSDARAIFVAKQHEILLQKVCSILEEEGFKDKETNVRYRKNGIDEGQFDIIALKNSEVLHIECKTRRMPWRMRMYLNPKGMEKDGLDFMEDNRLTEDMWAKKNTVLKDYLLSSPRYASANLSSIVVTDMPTPARDICRHARIVWIAHLKDYIAKEFQLV